MKNQTVKIACKILFVLTDAIREVGEIPAGHLYAACMDKIDLETFNCAINCIVKSGVVTREGDLLKFNRVCAAE